MSQWNSFRLASAQLPNQRSASVRIWPPSCRVSWFTQYKLIPQTQLGSNWTAIPSHLPCAFRSFASGFWLLFGHENETKRTYSRLESRHYYAMTPETNTVMRYLLAWIWTAVDHKNYTLYIVDISLCIYDRFVSSTVPNLLIFFF